MYQSRNWKYTAECNETIFGKGGENYTISCPLKTYVITDVYLSLNNVYNK